MVLMADAKLQMEASAWAKQVLAAAASAAQRESLLMLSKQGFLGYVLPKRLLGDLSPLLTKVFGSNEMLQNLQRLTLQQGRQVLHSPFLTSDASFQQQQCEPVLRPLRLRGGIKAGIGKGLKTHTLSDSFRLFQTLSDSFRLFQTLSDSFTL